MTQQGKLGGQEKQGDVVRKDSTNISADQSVLQFVLILHAEIYF